MCNSYGVSIVKSWCPVQYVYSSLASLLLSPTRSDLDHDMIQVEDPFVVSESLSWPL
jgi:hypothetical protein